MNTEWCIAFCVFTGNDTRLMINSQSVRVKLSALEKKLNYFVVWILVIQVIVCITTSFMETKWNFRGSQIYQSYIPDQYGDKVSGTITFFSYFLLMNTMLPISLFVTLEVLKLCEALVVSWDYLMFSVQLDKPALVSSSSLMEELGQINYLFSDKTGTLTRNEMKMSRMAIGS